MKNYYTLFGSSDTVGKKSKFGSTSGSPTTTKKTSRGWLASLFIMMSLFIGQFANAQVSGYSFSQTSGTYTAITGGTVLATQTVANGTAAGALDDVNYTVALPFNFTYSGVTYTSGTNINVNTNGFVSFGAAPTVGTYGVIGSTNVVASAIAGFSSDLNGGYAATISTTSGSPIVTVTAGNGLEFSAGQSVIGSTGLPAGLTVVSSTATTVTLSGNATSTGTARTLHVAKAEIRFQTIGSSPNQKLVIQYTNMRPYNTTLRRFDLQIVLNETSNAVDVIYGSSIGSTTSSTTQVGLRGATNANYNNRSTTTDWSSTIAGTSNTASCTFSSTVTPASGLMFSWTPPSCFAPSGLTNSSITSTSASHSWTAASPAPSVGYEWAVTTSATPPASGTATVGLTASSSGLTANTTYYLHVRSSCGAGNFSNWSTQSFYTGYCLASSTGQGSWFSVFNTTGGVSNISYSSASGTAGGYQDLTATSVSNYLGGSVTNLSFTAGGPTCGIAVWVDWNNNLVFEAGEKMFVTAGYITTATGSITIPAATPNGNYRMRMVVDWNTSVPVNACGNITRGEYKDFTFSVVSAPACSAPTAVTSNTVTSTTANIAWTAPATGTTPAGYNYEVRTSGLPGSGGATASGSTATTSASVSGLTANTSYSVYVQTDCGGSGTSTWSSAATFSTPCDPITTFPYTQDFESVTVPAIPSCTSIQTVTGNPWTTVAAPGSTYGFTSKTLRYSYSSSAAANSWFYLPAMNLVGGTTYKIDYRYGAAGFAERLKVSYGTAATEASMSTLIVDNGSFTTSPLNGTGEFTPATSGTYYVGFNAYSLVDEFWLFVDDIVITELIPCSGAPAAAVVSAPSASVCAGVPFTLSATGETTGAGISYQWESASDMAFTTGVTALGTSLTQAIASQSTATYYRMSTTCVTGPATTYSNVVFVGQNAPLACYCAPSAFTSNVEPITSVNFAGINNTSAAATGGPSYEDYTTVSGTVIAGAPYTMTLKGNTDGTTFTNNFRVFVDANQDGAFSASETFNAGSITGSTGLDAISAVSTIVVPGTALVGPTRLRVKKLYGTTNIDNPCIGGGYGQIEDYTVNVVQLTTGLNPHSCGTTLAQIYTNITAISLPGVDGYRFKVTDMSDNSVQTIDKTGPSFSLSQLATYAFAREYSVEVMLSMNGTFLGYYGPACAVYSPGYSATPVTVGPAAIVPAQRGATLPTIYSTIFSNGIAGVSDYRFEVTNTITNLVQTFDNTRPYFRLTNLPFYTYATPYSIRVAVKTASSSYGPFGDAYIVNSPALEMITECGTTVTAGSTLHMGPALTGVTNYEFTVVESLSSATDVINRNVPFFSTSLITGYDSAKQYSISVKVTSTGLVSPSSMACNINPVAEARFANGSVSSDFKAVAYPNPFATNFKLDVSTSSSEVINVAVYDMVGKMLSNQEVNTSDINTLEIGNNYSAGMYNVIVSQGNNVKSIRMVKN